MYEDGEDGEYKSDTELYELCFYKFKARDNLEEELERLLLGKGSINY